MRMALCFAAMLATAFPAQAADWTGGYFGVESGLGIGQHSFVFYSPAGDHPASAEYVGASGGFVAGYLFEADNVLFGVETKIGFGGAGRYVTDPATSISYRISQSYYAAVLGKVGIPKGSFLPYVSAGIGLSDVVSGFTAPGAPETIRAYGSSAGIVGAIGAEIAVTNQLSLKLEYSASSAVHSLYNYVLGEADGFAPHSAVNLGLNFRF